MNYNMSDLTWSEYAKEEEAKKLLIVEKPSRFKGLTSKISNLIPSYSPKVPEFISNPKIQLAVGSTAGILALIGAFGYYVSNSQKNTNVENSVEIVQEAEESVNNRLKSLEEIVGTFEKNKITGKPLVYRIDMNFDGNTEEVKVTTAKSSKFEVKYTNQKPQNVTLDLPFVGENILSRYFINPDDKVIQTVQKNPQMICDLKDYAQKLKLWTSNTDSDFTKGYIKLYSIANNPKCE